MSTQTANIMSTKFENTIKNLDLLARFGVYGRMTEAQRIIVTSNICDYECQYIHALHKPIPIQQGFEQCIPTMRGEYSKLFTECPILTKLPHLPHLDNIIVAGGFINIALDDCLEYENFPTSDIDIFVVGKNGRETIQQLLSFFDKFGARYKECYGIINVQLPSYHREIQIIWHDKNNVYDMIAHFHTSNVKCGFYMGKLIMMPDCAYTLRTKVAIIDETNINAYTLEKIIMRKYLPYGFEQYIGKDFSKFPSVIEKKKFKQEFESLKSMNSRDVMQHINEPVHFNHNVSIICPELLHIDSVPIDEPIVIIEPQVSCAYAYKCDLSKRPQCHYVSVRDLLMEKDRIEKEFVEMCRNDSACCAVPIDISETRKQYAGKCDLPKHTQPHYVSKCDISNGNVCHCTPIHPKLSQPHYVSKRDIFDAKARVVKQQSPTEGLLFKATKSRPGVIFRVKDSKHNYSGSCDIFRTPKHMSCFCKHRDVKHE